MRPTDDPGVVAATEAIVGGDHAKLEELLRSDPALATDRHGSEQMSRTLLHAATDWPGNFPGVAQTIALLVAAGAGVDARFEGPHTETPLHWAASSDDVAALDALLDAGADIEADGGVIAGGTPLFDAVAFGQWNAARRLVERGARTELWHEAALDLGKALSDRLAANPAPTMDDLDNALWHAANGGAAASAALLLAAGANPDRISWDDLSPIGAAERAGHAELAEALRRHRRAP